MATSVWITEPQTERSVPCLLFLFYANGFYHRSGVWLSTITQLWWWMDRPRGCKTIFDHAATVCGAAGLEVHLMIRSESSVFSAKARARADLEEKRGLVINSIPLSLHPSSADRVSVCSGTWFLGIVMIEYFLCVIFALFFFCVCVCVWVWVCMYVYVDVCIFLQRKPY